jgi:hypothetical protein
LAVAVLATAGAFWIAGAGVFLSPADQVTDAERVARARAYDAATPIDASALPPLEAMGEVQRMGLDGADALKLQDDLRRSVASAQDVGVPAVRDVPATARTAAVAPPMRLVRLTLWDTHADDGDVVRIRSIGYSRDVAISRTPATIAIPMREGDVVRLLGVRDGGGGITIGVSHESVPLPLPLMSEGQELTLPLKLR